MFDTMFTTVQYSSNMEHASGDLPVHFLWVRRRGSRCDARHWRERWKRVEMSLGGYLIAAWCPLFPSTGSGKKSSGKRCFANFSYKDEGIISDYIWFNKSITFYLKEATLYRSSASRKGVKLEGGEGMGASERCREVTKNATRSWQLSNISAQESHNKDN